MYDFCFVLGPADMAGALTFKILFYLKDVLLHKLTFSAFSLKFLSLCLDSWYYSNLYINEMIPFTLTIFTSYFLVKIKYYHSFFFFFIYLFYLRINLMWTLLLVLPFATQTTHLRYLSFRLLVKQLQILWFFDLHYCWPTSGNCFFWSERY